jgi:hypothetical protein
VVRGKNFFSFFPRTVGRLKAPLLLLQTAAFIGATLCGFKHLHGHAMRLFSVFVFFVGPLSL